MGSPLFGKLDALMPDVWVNYIVPSTINVLRFCSFNKSDPDCKYIKESLRNFVNKSALLHMLQTSIQPAHFYTDEWTGTADDKFQYPLLPLCYVGDNSQDKLDTCQHFYKAIAFRPDCYTFNNNQSDLLHITRLGTDHGLSMILDSYFGNEEVSFHVINIFTR